MRLVTSESTSSVGFAKDIFKIRRLFWNIVWISSVIIWDSLSVVTWSEPAFFRVSSIQKELLVLRVDHKLSNLFFSHWTGYIWQIETVCESVMFNKTPSWKKLVKKVIVKVLSFSRQNAFIWNCCKFSLNGVTKIIKSKLNALTLLNQNAFDWPIPHSFQIFGAEKMWTFHPIVLIWGTNCQFLMGQAHCFPLSPTIVHGNLFQKNYCRIVILVYCLV